MGKNLFTTFAKRIAPLNWRATVLAKIPLNEHVTKLVVLPTTPIITPPPPPPSNNNNHNNNINNPITSPTPTPTPTTTPLPSSFRAYPGQYCFFLPLPQWQEGVRSGELDPRSVSKAGFSMINSFNSRPLFHENELQFAIKLSHHKMTEYVFSEECVPGESQVEIVGPDGHFMYVQPTEQQVREHGLDLRKWTRVNMIGGGIGITPMVSIWNYLTNLERPLTGTRVKLLYGARLANDLVFKNELETALQRSKNVDSNQMSMQLFYNLSEEPCSVLGNQGQCNVNCLSSGELDRPLIERIFFAEDDEGRENFENGLFYICGPNPMVDSTVNILLDIGVKKEQLVYGW